MINTEKIKQVLLSFFKKAWEYLKTAKLELIILSAVIAVDIISKIIAANTIDLGERIVLIPKFLQLTYTENRLAAFGSFFGLKEGPAAMALLITFTTLATGFLCYLLYRFRNDGKFVRITMSLMIAGALGNLIDRVFLGYVRDFIELVYLGLKIFGSETFPIFNIADSALSVSIVMFIIWIIFYYKPDEKKPKKQKEVIKEKFFDADGNPIPDDDEQIVQADVHSDNIKIIENAAEQKIQAEAAQADDNDQGMEKM